MSSAGGCRPVVARLDAYADGELAPEQVLEIEAHLADCHPCSSRLQLDHAVRKSLRRATYAAAMPTDAFRERLLASLGAESGRAEAAEAVLQPARSTMLSWSNIVPLAAAAAFALLWTAIYKPPVVPTPGVHPIGAAVSEPFNVEKLLDDIITSHLDRSAPSVTEASLVDELAPEVGVAVHAPSLLQYGARWEGGSVVPLRNERSAALRYRVAGHRMTLYVFNAERFPLNTRFKKRIVRDEPVYVAWKRGYSVAATDRHGVGYAVTTDLGEDEGAEIVASLH